MRSPSEVVADGNLVPPGGRAWAALLAVALTLVACSRAPESKPEARQVGWRPIESFSGQTPLGETGPQTTQTDSFNIESTQWRIRWDNKALGNLPPGAFTVVVHSAVSGRPMQVAVEQHGAGHGVAYVTEDPRLYHLVVNAENLAWNVHVEEAVVGVPVNAP